MYSSNLIAIVGPTCIGKTQLAIEIAQHYQTQIISADSRQFFKELSIGTAKPSEEELKNATHHFINNKSILETYNVGEYEKEVIQLLDSLFNTFNPLIIVGGSGLYIDAICNGLDDLPKSNEEIRKKLTSLLNEKGIEELALLLEKYDPIYYNEVDKKNPQRIIRALEVCLGSGKPYSSFKTKKKKERSFKTIKIGLECNRKILYSNINARVDTMIKNGLIEEVRKVISYKNANALQTVGYKELIAYIEGEIDLNTAIELIKKNTRNFAKRQLTWFKKDKGISWFQPQERERIFQFIEANLTKETR